MPVRIDAHLKSELIKWSRSRRTTLVMSVFTAYAALVLRWCDVSETIVQFQSDGRVSPLLRNTLGFFAFMLYLRVELCENDSFIDLIDRITHEHSKAYEHADFSYFASQLPRAEWLMNTSFNWIPGGAKTHTLGSDGEVECSPIKFVHPMGKILEVEGEPSMVFSDTGADEIYGEVFFPLNRFLEATMERFGRNLLVFIEALLTKPEVPVKRVPLV